jgi:hypothetical protein
MKSKKLSGRKKLDYEKPGIKEEVIFEQKALACGGNKNGGGMDGGNKQSRGKQNWGMCMMS